MSIALVFWVLWIVGLVYGAIVSRSSEGMGRWFAVWIMLGLLGWKVFGPVIQG